MGKVNAKLGTDYQLFNYYGAPTLTASSSQWVPSATWLRKLSTI